MRYFVKTVNKRLRIDLITIPLANNGHRFRSIGATHGVRKTLFAFNLKLNCGFGPAGSPNRLSIEHEPVHIEDNRLEHTAS